MVTKCRVTACGAYLIGYSLLAFSAIGHEPMVVLSYVILVAAGSIHAAAELASGGLSMKKSPPGD